MKHCLPLLLYLPFRLVSDFNVKKLLASEGDLTWSEGWQLLEQLEMSPGERRFAKALMASKKNLWLFRCNQRRFCGDFVIVDMSSPWPDRRRVYIVELKANTALKEGAGGVQLSCWHQAIEALDRQQAIVRAPAVVRLITGDNGAVLSFLRSLKSRGRHDTQGA